MDIQLFLNLRQKPNYNTTPQGKIHPREEMERGGVWE